MFSGMEGPLLKVGRLGLSERLRTFVEEMPYERGPILDFVQRASDRLPPGSDVADIGAGDAPYRELFEHTNYCTIDWEHSLHEQAAASDIVASADNLPVEDKSFDAVLLTQVLEHVPEPTRVLVELFRVLRPRGFLFLTAPLAWELHELPFDFYRYTANGLEYLARGAGFEEIEVVPRNDCFTTLAQLMWNVAWMTERGSNEEDERHANAAATLQKLAGEVASFAPLDVSRILPLGYALTARRG